MKNLSVFEKKDPNFSTVSRNSSYSVAFHRNFATFSDFKNTLDIFWKDAAFCQKPIFWTFEELLLIQSHSEANLLLFRFFMEITVFFFKKAIYFSFSKSHIERFEKSFFFSPIWRQNCYLYCFLKQNTFFSKNPYFLTKKKDFEPFEKSYLFSRILQPICYLYCFLKQNNFFRKTHIF